MGCVTGWQLPSLTSTRTVHEGIDFCAAPVGCFHDKYAFASSVIARVIVKLQGPCVSTVLWLPACASTVML